MVITSERKLVAWKKSKAAVSFAVSQAARDICLFVWFVCRKKASLFWQISYVAGIGEKITERVWREQKNGGRGGRRGGRASGAAYATQSERTYAENVETSKKVARYFLEPS